MKKVTAFVVAIIKKSDKFLLTKRREIDKEDPQDFFGKWQLPGGGINFGEKLGQAAKREIKEEIGLDVEITSIVPYIIDEIRDKWHGIGIVLLCKQKKSNQKVKLNSEASEFGWFTLNEVMRLEVLPGGKEAINASYFIGGRGGS